MTAAVALALGAALVLGAASTAAVLAVAVGLVQALVAARWFPAVTVPGGRTGPVIALAAAATADVLVARADGVHPMGPAASVAGVAFLAALVQQLARRDGRPALTASLSATVALVVLAVLGAGYVAAAAADDGDWLVAAVAVCAAVLAASTALPGPSALSWTVGAVAAGGAGALVLGLGDLDRRAVVVVPLAATATAAVGRLLATRLPRPDPWLAAALPLLLVGPAALVLARLLTA